MPRNRNGSEKLKRKGSKAVRDTSEKPSPPSPNPDSVLQNNNQAVDNSNESTNLGRTIYSMIRLSFGFFLTRHFIIKAFEVRMHAINEYGYVIHEFDPWFNFRATEYLYENGWEAFSKWFDYKSWYPLGRPVGTTIYPGMQVTAVFMKNYIMKSFSLNDVCVLIPSIFGSIATLLTGMLAYECSVSNSTSYYSNIETFVAAMAGMSIVPAHLMRSIGGGYDNESIAVTAMVLTFYCWCRSLRPGPNNHYYAFLTAFAYFYMVAAWGGYVFVLNMIALHAGVLVLIGRFSQQVYLAYSIFYVVGTALAMQVPVVGMTPLKSFEQLGAFALFGGYQLLQLSNYLFKRQQEHLIKQKKPVPRTMKWKIRILVFSGATVLALMIIALVLPKNYFGPISARVRGLFLQHTKTGNPLVDSVAEHQAASKSAYFTYLHYLCAVAPIGFVMSLTQSIKDDRASFLCLYGLTTYFFSSKMVRLILLLGPVASALGGVAIGKSCGWALSQLVPFAVPFEEKPKKSKKKSQDTHKETMGSRIMYVFNINPESEIIAFTKKVMATAIISLTILFWITYSPYCEIMARRLSNPSIVFKGRLSSGKEILVDDYREAYNWLRENTPEDSRILAWWDYGYQITGIANRTTIADGNTWNHEHIALLGMILTGPEKQSHRIMRHLADYVLIWGGGGGDDLAKSPHLARIANSVYRGHCPGDPTCRGFTFIDREGTPSPMMGRSLLWKLHGHGLKPNAKADPNRFTPVFSSRYGKVRIYKILGVSKESKEWVANPANRLCDAPGSWFCPGQYPPALEPVLKSKTDFAQLEDFNKGKTDDEYQKAYFENLKDGKKAFKDAMAAEKESSVAKSQESKLEKDILNDRIRERQNTWQDNEESTAMWNLINNNEVDKVKAWLKNDPSVVYMRSKDGRGPMWWAYEGKKMQIAKELMNAGASVVLKDKYGKSPLDLLTEQKEL